MLTDITVEPASEPVEREVILPVYPHTVSPKQRVAHIEMTVGTSNLMVESIFEDIPRVLLYEIGSEFHCFLLIHR